jgi:hypothetical protein
MIKKKNGKRYRYIPDRLWDEIVTMAKEENQTAVRFLEDCTVVKRVP